MSIQVGSNTLGSYPATLTSNTGFYKYEPFSFTFTGGSNFTASGTLLSYCTTTTSSVTFAAPTGFQSTGSPFGETLVISNDSESRTYAINVYAGRFVVTPAPTAAVFYRNESVSYTLTSAVQLTTAYTVPTLPPGLTFASTVGNTAWTLTGTPLLTTVRTNYLFLGSNVTTGNVVSVSLSIQVAGERIVMSPTTSPSNVLTIGQPITPIPFTVTNYPSTATRVAFSSSNLPLGLSVQTSSSAFPASTTIIGTPADPGTEATSVSSTLTATATGFGTVSTSSTLSFTYASSLVFTAPTVTTVDIYPGVPYGLQVTARPRFSTADVYGYTATNLPPGLSMTIIGFISGTPTSLGTYVSTVTARAIGLSSTVTLTFNVIRNTATVNTVPTQSFVVGRAITPLVFTFTSAAKTEIARYTSNLPAGLYRTPSETGNTVTLIGVPTTPSSSGFLTVTATTTDGATAIGRATYTTVSDTFTFTSFPATLLFRQNIPITPIQFSAVSACNSAPISYYTNTPAIPPGLYVTPGGTLRGAPTQVAANATLTGVTATNGYVTETLSNFTYTVIPDEILARSSNVSNILIPGQPVGPIGLTLQTLGDLSPTGPISFSAYSYGLTGTASSIGGTVDSSIVLPAYSVLPGRISGLPTVFGLGAINRQIIHHYMIGSSGSSYTLYQDNGDFAFAPTPLQVYYAPMIGHITPASGNSAFLHLTSGAPPITMPIGTLLYGSTIAPGTSILSGGGSVYLVGPRQTAAECTITAVSFLSDPIRAPMDFQWSPTTFVIADGTSDLLVSSDSTTFTRTSLDMSGILQCAYMSNVSRWAALDLNSIAFSATSDPADGWYAAGELFGQPISTNGTYVLRTRAVATSTRFLLGGTLLKYCDVPNSQLTAGRTLTFINCQCDLLGITSIVVSSPLIAGGDPSVPDGPTMQYSSDGITWSNTTNSFTTRTSYIVSSGDAAVGWLAVGFNGTTPGIKYSSDAIVWLDVPVTATSDTFGPIRFDGTSWCVMDGYTVHTHDAFASTMTSASAWRTTTATNLTGTLSFFPETRITGGPATAVLYIGETPNGPTFDSPVEASYLLYQYVVMPPITFHATSTSGDAPVYFLTSTPPPGMSWDPTTAVLSGRSVQLGTFTVDVYAQSAIGVSKKTVTFIVSQLQIGQTLPTAAAYTAYQREKVIADAATATVNNHTVSFEVGPFLLPRPPNRVDAPEFCCEKVSK